MAQGNRIFHQHIAKDFPLASKIWRPCTVGWVDHVASLDTEMKRKMSALAKNQTLTLRCSVDNPVSIVTVLTHTSCVSLR